jgi:hypothetical protein
MAKKKKKVNSTVSQKVHAAQLKNTFIERLRKFCALISVDEPLFDLLTPKMLTIIHFHRGISIKIKVAEGAKITKRFVRIMYSHIENEMKGQWVDIVMGDVKQRVNLVDYYQIVFPLETAMLEESYQFRGKEKFNAFCVDAESRYEKYTMALVNIIHTACFAYGNLSTRTLYTFVYDMKWSTEGPFYQTITLGVYTLQIRYVEINKERRPVIQTGEIRHKDGVSTLKPTTVSFKQLPVNSIKGMQDLPVYVQQHAVNRTMQRACCVYPGAVPSLIHKAFIENRKIIRDGDKFLVECFYFEFKIGYFVARIIDGMFVIITFLLITHSSTPEGKKLSQLTGLKRDDIKFLAIDDLKTLVNSNIIFNDRIYKIFVDAGCESILKMNFDMIYGDFYWLRDDTKQSSNLAKLITEYIQLGDEDEDYFENEG